MRRVVVTGLGLITALGTGIEKSWAGIISGKTGVKTIEAFDTEDTPVKVAGEVRDFNPETFGIEKKEIKKLARNTQFAIGAAKMALEDSGFTIDENNAERVGVIVSPRKAVSFTASERVKNPPEPKAAYSPTECPATKSGVIPFSLTIFSSTRLIATIAG